MIYIYRKSNLHVTVSNFSVDYNENRDKYESNHLVLMMSPTEEQILANILRSGGAEVVHEK